MSDTPAQRNSHTQSSESGDEYDFPGQLTVWEPGTKSPNEDSAISEVPEEYVLVEVSTPLTDKAYLLPVSNFTCGLHPGKLDAQFICRTETALEVIFSLDSNQHIVFERSLKEPTETIRLKETPAPTVQEYTDAVPSVIWTAPKADAALVES